MVSSRESHDLVVEHVSIIPQRCEVGRGRDSLYFCQDRRIYNACEQNVICGIISRYKFLPREDDTAPLCILFGN